MVKRVRRSRTQRQERMHTIGLLLADFLFYLQLWVVSILGLAKISLALIPGTLTINALLVILGALICALLWPIFRRFL